jgi:hypothetical protein
MMKFPALPLAVLLGASAVAGCSKAQARVVPDMPALDVPAPPPRVVEANEPGILAPGTLVEEPARNTPTTRRPPAARPDPARTETAKPDAPAAVEAPPATPPEEPATRPPGAPTLQTTPADRAPDVERSVRAQLDQARLLLSNIPFQRLNTGARTQYNQARVFITTAEEALKERNLVLAQVNAEKAATIARQLSGR